MLILLQVPDAKISLFSLLGKGGWIMYPLYALLVIAIYVFIERFLAIKKAGQSDENDKGSYFVWECCCCKSAC
jgi:hypothetical protein